MIHLNLSYRPLLVALAVLLCSLVASAEDIEVYNSDRTLPYPPYELTGDVAPPNPNYPNVLFILDASWSMTNKDGKPTSRISRLREAMQLVLDSTENVNIAVMTYSLNQNGGRVIYPMSPIEYAREDAMQMINTMALDWYTPTMTALMEAAYYFSGSPVSYGKKRAANPNQRKNKQPWKSRVSHPDSYTGGTVYREPGCTDADLNHRDCLSEEITDDPVYRSPMLSQCQANYQILITDGATENIPSSVVQSLTGSGCSGTACADAIASHMATQDLRPDLDGVNTVKTYTVGFNTSQAFLESMAEAGGGEYFESDSAAELADTLTSVLAEVSVPPVTFSPPTITVDSDNVYSNRKDIYLTLFEPSLNPVWAGNLKGYWFDGELKDYSNPRVAALNPDNGLLRGGSISRWSDSADGGSISAGGAASELRIASLRNVVTNPPDGNQTELVNDNNRITLNNISAAELELPDNLLQLDISDAADIINWVNGVDVHDVNENGSTTDNRQQFGDPLHSNPVIVNHGLTAGGEFESTVYFGTNTGFLHGVNTLTGEDVFSFMPWELIGNIKHAYVNLPYAAKLYGMDGFLTAWSHDTNDNGYIDAAGDFAHLYAGMRRGGRNYYALDVTDNESPELLWQITGGEGDFVELGQTWSKMLRAKMLHPTTDVLTDVLVFSGGYDDSQDDVQTRTGDSMGRAVYIVDALTGALVWSAGIHTDADLKIDEMVYSIAASPSVIDVDGDGLFDQIYATDTGGQIFRFDFQDNGVISGGRIADFSADNVRFFASADVSLAANRETNEQYLMVSVGSGTRSRPLATENNGFYVIKQTGVHNAPADYGYQPDNAVDYAAITRQELVDITSNKIREGTEEERNQLTSDLKTGHGWYLSMERQNEKIFNTSITADGKMVFTSFVPGFLSACSLNPGTNYLYVIDVHDGAPTQDTNNNGVVDSDDRSEALEVDGISAPPTTIFTTNADGSTSVSVVVGTESTPFADVSISKRTYWTESPEF